MTSILRVKARWSGFSGAPGYTVMHFRDFATGDGSGTEPSADQALDAAARVNTFFADIAGLLPATVSVVIEPEVEMLEDTDGKLVTAFSAGNLPVVNGLGGEFYSGPTGAVVNWRTGAVRNGRRVRGRTFLVPLHTGAFNETGQLGPNSTATLQAAANTLAASTGTPDLGVYARPSLPGATDGLWSAVTSATVPRLAAVLRSRRD